MAALCNLERRPTEMAEARAHLKLLSSLLEVARPGAHYPDAHGLGEWVALLARPWTGRTAPAPQLDRASGLPTPSSLERLLERQRVAKAFFAAHRAVPARSSDQFNAALAAARLFSPGSAVRLVSVDGGQSRLLAVHDAFTAAGTVARFSVLLTQRRARHVRVGRSGGCTPEPAFVRALGQACGAGAAAAALALSALEHVWVHEVVRGELGPCVTAHAGRLPALPPAPGPSGGVLSLLLERVGETVTTAYCADLWPDDDADNAGRLEAAGWRRSRERRLACTPEWHDTLEALARPARVLVRSR